MEKYYSSFHSRICAGGKLHIFFCRTAIHMGSLSKTVNHLIMFVVKKLTSPQNDSLTAIL